MLAPLGGAAPAYHRLWTRGCDRAVFMHRQECEVQNGNLIQLRRRLELNKAYDLFDNEVDDCLRLYSSMLDDSACPRYHRIKTLLLLGYFIGDWHEANKCRINAEALWRAKMRLPTSICRSSAKN